MIGPIRVIGVIWIIWKIKKKKRNRILLYCTKKIRVWRRGEEESHGGREKPGEVQFSQQVSVVRHLSKKTFLPIQPLDRRGSWTQCSRLVEVTSDRSDFRFHDFKSV